ncbi:MAG: hypothetical protein IKE43_10595 [Coriobacteriales bacterium]|nr:hypothetical protein [Coriobacteriales bacterium]
MIEVLQRPLDADQYDQPIIHFDEYSDEDVLEYFQSNPSLVKLIHDIRPELYSYICSRFEKDLIDEIIEI